MVVEYADLQCPYCAQAHLILKELPITRVFRHFPVTSKLSSASPTGSMNR